MVDRAILMLYFRLWARIRSGFDDRYLMKMEEL